MWMQEVSSKSSVLKKVQKLQFQDLKEIIEITHNYVNKNEEKNKI